MLKYTITSVLILIVLVSCKKELSNQTANIQGNYKFVSLIGHTKNISRTSTTGDNFESTTYTDYISQNNTGTVKIDASTITSQNLAYSVDTTMTSYINDNGTKDTVQFPFVITMPPSSGTTNYKSVTADSIYCPSGSIFMNGQSQATMPTGVKLKTDGNKLYMTFQGSQTNTQNIQGQTIYMYTEVKSTITLQKM